MKQTKGLSKKFRKCDNWNNMQTGLLVSIEVLTSVYGGWSGDAGSSDWGKVPPMIPVLIFSLVYHDLAPGENNFFEVY